jgi:hypothetical protein
MSYDVNFWKQARPLDMSAQEIYERLSEGEPVEGLATLPVDEILGQLRDASPVSSRRSKMLLCHSITGCHGNVLLLVLGVLAAVAFAAIA